MSTYSSIPTAGDDLVQYAAVARARRLNKSDRNWVLGLILDIIFGILPWVLGSALAATVLTAIYTNVDNAPDVFILFNTPVAVSAISTFASFLLVSKQSSNFGKNSTIVGQYGNLTGSLTNICLFVKSQVSSGKSVEFLTLPDGQSGFFQTTRIGLACASIPYIGERALLTPCVCVCVCAARVQLSTPGAERPSSLMGCRWDRILSCSARSSSSRYPPTGRPACRPSPPACC
jgi:hypothetical protein